MSPTVVIAGAMVDDSEFIASFVWLVFWFDKWVSRQGLKTS
ncbi:hypothetical protein [Nostoc sp.]